MGSSFEDSLFTERHVNVYGNRLPQAYLSILLLVSVAALIDWAGRLCDVCGPSLSRG